MGTVGYDKRIIGAITNHWLAYIIPQNDSTIFETIPTNENSKPGYGIRLIIKRVAKPKFKIAQVQFNESC